MGQNDFDYLIPDNFNIAFSHFLQQNGAEEMGKRIRNCNIDYDDVGFAYYAGLRGDNWGKHAVNVTIIGHDEDISYLRRSEYMLKDKMQQFLRPSKSGLLIKDVNFIVGDNDFEINLPDDIEESFDTLTSDIHDAIRKKEPALVLDRLHTYSVRYIGKLCRSHSISISDDKGKNYALHSLVGRLGKYYNAHISFQSDFVEKTLKMSISAFERFNAIRNDHSYAHDNDVLNKAESIYVISIITAVLRLFYDIENAYY